MKVIGNGKECNDTIRFEIMPSRCPSLFKCFVTFVGGLRWNCYQFVGGRNRGMETIAVVLRLRWASELECLLLGNWRVEFSLDNNRKMKFEFWIFEVFERFSSYIEPSISSCILNQRSTDSAAYLLWFNQPSLIAEKLSISSSLNKLHVQTFPPIFPLETSKPLTLRKSPQSHSTFSPL
jgi:hypothetical protein